MRNYLKGSVCGKIFCQLPFALILSIFLCSSSSPQDPQGISIVDPPAINVFPDHDDVVAGRITLEEFINNGKALFRTTFNTLDGAGRPRSTGDSKPTFRTALQHAFNRVSGPDASSCVDCHNKPLHGGAGGFASNVFVGAHFSDPPISSIEARQTNERNTISIFGAGAIEMVAREMTERLKNQLLQATIQAEHLGEDITIELNAKGVSFGHLTVHPNGTYDVDRIEGIDMDLVVKPFGVKGVAVSIREFSNFALNQHHGIQSEERFGFGRTGVSDFDEDGVSTEFTIGQLSALSIYQASLPAPARKVNEEKDSGVSSRRGEQKFNDIGCADCHIPSLPLKSAWFLEPNPYNRPGSLVPSDVSGQIALHFDFRRDSGLFQDQHGNPHVAAYTDLKRHVICDSDDNFYCNEMISQDFVPTDQFITAKLWDVGSSAPYGHRGNITTLSEAIIHHSGEAKASKLAFLALARDDRNSIVRFLMTLRVREEEAVP